MNDPTRVPGITFWDNRTKRKMRYIYPQADHSLGGWLIVQCESGDWMTLRKATDEDKVCLNEALVRAHHQGGK